MKTNTLSLSRFYRCLVLSLLTIMVTVSIASAQTIPDNPAGPDRTVTERTVVTLGLPANDFPLGTIFTWELISYDPALDTERRGYPNNLRNPYFIAPSNPGENLEFELEVMFKLTLTGTGIPNEPLEDFVTITVVNVPNNEPIANAGPAQTVLDGI